MYCLKRRVFDAYENHNSRAADTFVEGPPCLIVHLLHSLNIPSLCNVAAGARLSGIGRKIVRHPAADEQRQLSIPPSPNSLSKAAKSMRPTESPMTAIQPSVSREVKSSLLCRLTPHFTASASQTQDFSKSSLQLAVFCPASEHLQQGRGHSGRDPSLHLASIIPSMLVQVIDIFEAAFFNAYGISHFCEASSIQSPWFAAPKQDALAPTPSAFCPPDQSPCFLQNQLWEAFPEGKGQLMNTYSSCSFVALERNPLWSIVIE